MKQWERMVGGDGGSLQLEAGFPGPCTAGLREAAHSRVGGRGGQARTRPPAAAVLAAGIRAVPSRPREREPLPYSCSSKQNITAFQQPKSSISTPPQTILLIGSSAHGMMRAAEGGPAVRSRSRPARAGAEAGVVVVGPVRLAPGARGPRGGGARGSAAATAPPAAGALPKQRSSVARVCTSSEVLLLRVLLLGPLLLLPLPSAAAPAAGSSSPSLPLFALSAPTFPSPGRRRTAPRQPRGRLQTEGCERGCDLCILSPRPWCARQRTARCPGLGTEAQPGRHGWALGFWVRQPRLGFFCLFPPPFPHLPPEEETL